jgi:hypothetical protein
MASLIYDSFADDLSRGSIDMDTDTFYAMLVTSAYTPSKTTHLKRSDVTNEVSGTGYAAGGIAVACTVAKNTGANTETFTFANPSWAASTITAHAAVIYKHRGGASTADELVCYVDFGADVTSTAGTFAVTFSSPLTIQN